MLGSVIEKIPYMVVGGVITYALNVFKSIYITNLKYKHELPTEYQGIIGSGRAKFKIKRMNDNYIRKNKNKNVTRKDDFCINCMGEDKVFDMDALKSSLSGNELNDTQIEERSEIARFSDFVERERLWPPAWR